MIDAEYDLKAAWVLGMFHWLRYMSLPDGALVQFRRGGAATGERTGDTGLMVEAVQALRAAAAVSPPGHPGRAGYLSNLGVALQALSEAATTFREAAAEAAVAHLSCLQVLPEHAAAHLAPMKISLPVPFTTRHGTCAPGTPTPPDTPRSGCRTRTPAREELHVAAVPS